MKQKVSEIKAEARPRLREKNCILPRVLDGHGGGAWTVDSAGQWEAFRRQLFMMAL